MPDTKPVAAIVTEYRKNSHADVIVTKILEGYLLDGKEFPRMRLASLYCDQFPATDMSRALAEKHKFPIYDTIEGAITLGQNRVAVEGVLLIGEHGRYAMNQRGQTMYPRRRFFENTIDTFRHHKRVVPVFSDKHLSSWWDDAKWMYDKAREMFIPFMAGSSLPVTFRRPSVTLPRNAELVEVVQIGYGALDAYGFHALEGVQCMAERRKGGETGVRAVQCLVGEEMWRAMDQGVFSKDLLEAALERVPAHAKGDYRKLTAKSNNAALYLVEYRDGLKAAVAMMNGYVYEGDGGAFTFAGRIRGQDKPLATHYYLQQPDPFAHFAYQLRAIDAMIQTGHPSYPVERTLLATGILDAALISRNEKGRRIETPHLAIAYQPTEWPYATDPVPPRLKR